MNNPTLGVENGSNPLAAVYTTAPISGSGDPEAYRRHLINAARWSDSAGCAGILVYTDNNQLSPWLVAQIILQHTGKLVPLVATQPIYMHPYSVAKLITTLGHLYERRIDLNMVAGGFKNDLTALKDTTPHDERYARLTEYTNIITSLCASSNPVTVAGRYYSVENLVLKPPLPAHLAPRILLSGSSGAGLDAARQLGATAIQYPGPAQSVTQTAPADESYGIRVGIICREDSGEAWRAAHEKFPPDHRGQLTHQLAMKTSDSSWHSRLAETGEAVRDKPTPYWLFPFENYKTFCPYLVGSYREVARELGLYLAAGYRTFILDIPTEEQEFEHWRRVFDLAAATLRNGQPAAQPSRVLQESGTIR